MQHPNTDRISYDEIEYIFKLSFNIQLSYTVTYLVDVIDRILKDAKDVTTINPWKRCKYISFRDYTLIDNTLFMIADLINKDVDEIKQILLTNLNINLNNLVFYKEK